MVEINYRMSELLDNQIDTQNENLKIKILGFTQTLVEVVMKIKKEELEKENNCCAKKFNERRTL